MKSLCEWRVQENVEQPAPMPEDWRYYEATVTGPLRAHLARVFRDLNIGPHLSTYKKAFILQEVMAALQIDPTKVGSILLNVKRAMEAKSDTSPLAVSKYNMFQPNLKTPDRPYVP